MSDMEEISYWVYTKRAPCLYNYDNQVKRQLADAERAAKPVSSPSDSQEVVIPKKKIKRKLSLLGDETSPEKQQNVYFETSQQKCTVLSSCKSDTLESEVDFNIKNSSIQGKVKRIKIQNNKNSGKVVHKKNKLVTSTPKAETPLRRSLRHSQRPHDYSAINYSFEMFNSWHNYKSLNKHEAKKTPLRQKRDKSNVERNAAGDHEAKISIGLDKIKKNGILTRPFEDVSDVSGLTANYIKSTKVKGNQSSRKLRSKSKPTRDTQHDKGDSVMVYTDKSINTKPKTGVLSASSDSSENIINFVTNKRKGPDKTPTVNKSTSLLKFVDAQTSKNQVNNNINKESSNTDLNASFGPRYNRSRHPKGLRAEVSANESHPTNERQRKPQGKNCCEVVNDRKENPEDSISRTRSGRSIGLALRQPENSVLLINNSTDQVSSKVTLNVAEPCAEKITPHRRRKKLLSSLKHVSVQQSTDNSDVAVRQGSTRERSGFAACFSDSETEGEPVKLRKFFC